MKIHLRFGMHRDIEVIHREADKIDGQVIPAHILAHQTASTAVFVTSLPTLPYVIDPMTYMFQHNKENWLNEAGDVRISLRKMCEGYHADIIAAINRIADDEFLGPADLPVVHDLCGCVMDFQLSVVARKSATSKAAKYLKRYGTTEATIPRAVIPPYFCFSTAGDDWYQFSLECAVETLDIAKGRPVMPVIAFTPGQVNEAHAARIVQDYGEFPAVLLWPGDFSQSLVEEKNIVRVRRIVNGFGKLRVRVEALYGGYLLMLMKSIGLNAVSHGILYTEHKGFGSTPGGGGVPDRYYIPDFHEFRSLSQTDLIFHKHPELICTCPVCNEIIDGNPDNIIRFADNPELLRRHFLTVRRIEADRLEESLLDDELAEVERIYDTYHESISSLPNPDSIVDTMRMKGLDYLQIWVNGLRAEI